MTDFYLKINDRLPELEATLEDSNGDAIDLTTATGVEFRMRANTTDPWILIAANIVTASEGKVSVPWGATDTDTAGVFHALFKVTFPGPLVMSVPNKGCKSIIIEDDC